MKDVKVLIGNYGSGKSELALNFAMQAAARGDRTELLDLDMVNTYFRLTERGKLVESSSMWAATMWAQQPWDATIRISQISSPALWRC